MVKSHTREPIVAGGVVGVAHGDHTVIMHIARGRYFGLSESGGRIWALLNDGRSLNQIVEMLANEYGIPRSRAEVDLLGFVAQLRQEGLVR